jgi:dTMP kinase
MISVETTTVPSFGPRALRRGVFLTFEGIEGAGKSLQVSLLTRRLRAAGLAVVATREPGGTRLGKRLRTILLGTSGDAVAPEAELHLYLADRAQHVREVVKPAIERGDVVVCDRYVDATIAYQGHGRGLSLHWIQELHRHPPLDLAPDRTVLLDLEPLVGLARARSRNEESGRSPHDRIEAEDLEFHRRVREGYRILASLEPERFRVIPADEAAEVVHRRVWEAVSDLLPGIA